MTDLLWMIPALPLLGFLVLVFGGRRLSTSAVAAVGVGSVGLSAALTLVLGAGFLSSPPPDGALSVTVAEWMRAGGFDVRFGLYLDALAMVMLFVVTFVGFWIHLYASEYMRTDRSYARFFAYMNLFVAAMLVLVLADSLPLLYLGWEGVGVCSYLLIGFWYQDDANARAAVKAFQVTRVGDAAMAVGLLLLFAHLGTLDIQPLLAAATAEWEIGATAVSIAALLLLGGAVGKSAQLPLQTWLPDAMAGPTPVSALIHAATMVTAGVYLIARMHPLFLLAPEVQVLVGVVGALTLLIAGFSALAQTDLKRILAYSTISQIGYMFVALGVGSWHAAIFHLFTHAFFKALLFLGAGAIINAVHHEQNIHRMGGLRTELPLVFWTFLIGGASLAGLPLVTAGFFSKDLILWGAFSAPIPAGTVLWAAGLLGSFLTGLYTFRMIFVVFFGAAHGHVHERPGVRMRTTLVVLAAFAVVAGYLETPHLLGHITVFSHFLAAAVPVVEASEAVLASEPLALAVAVLVSLAALAAAWYLFLERRALANAIAGSGAGRAVGRFWLSGCGFDRLYHWLFVAPFIMLAERNRSDVVDLLYGGIAAVSRGLHYVLRTSQTGRLRWYAASVGVGAVILLMLLIRP